MKNVAFDDVQQLLRFLSGSTRRWLLRYLPWVSEQAGAMSAAEVRKGLFAINQDADAVLPDPSFPRSDPLPQSEEQFHSVIESIDDAIITKSLQGIITGWNSAAVRLFGYSAQEAIGRPVTILFPQSNLLDEVALLRRIYLGERIPSFETVRVHKSGQPIDVSVTVSPLRNRQGDIIGACKLARDISEQKQQRDLIAHALEEKTALLHEVHHRVKNNLQIVSSLLNLQARKVSPAGAQAIAECQGRIRAMALVHELLYESDNMSEVNLSEYLHRLIVLTKATHSASSTGIGLTFSGGKESITLDIQRAIPCGLIIHELVLNAIKHAFIKARQGSIEVKLERVSPECIHLSVSDNGCGIPEWFQWGGTGSGLGAQLIPMFVSQLQGKLLTSSSENGACFTIELSPELRHGTQKVVHEI
ncbi:histidine kinase dimerization/phosphoacceptor domain -containing protein [Herbaspirillum sp. RTI4]|uniref:sensor histidine kinase n=1 Tax=Herbaspirillum sp. RTI4 TaxID=3048640 RepID=UPI002AB5A960|nr:histidine kinase dimerization/phosphoacceptor domain -containing protein [Herbaspirillum sp. RTI4]MDY7578680.1 histidine kinase dimerization/phosphoacceptor domain -containing protein [Herbaspirillum sp. RTI4]MEA9980622.1 histidine kinase dimerization/phosphoacceptor domain -containing protein [Herbaspirillum sp. RTI4]